MELSKIIFVSVFTFIAGFIDAIAGGGGLISLPAYVASGIPYHMALGTNKFSAFFSSFAASFQFAKKKLIDYRMVFFSVSFALIGSSLGSRSVLYFDQIILKKIFIFFVPFIAIIILSKKDFGLGKSNRSFKKKSYPIAFCIGFCIGFYDGFFGPGTGTFYMIAYCYFLGYDFMEASGNAKLINLSSNIASIVIFLVHKKIYFFLGLPAGLSALAGGYLGSKYIIKKGNKAVKPFILIILGLLLMKIILDLF